MEFREEQNRFTHRQRRRMRIKHQFKIRDASQDCEIHSTLIREDFQRIEGLTNNDCRFQIFIFDKFTTPATFSFWKITFTTEVCTCSQFPSEAMQWIKEVELADSVDDLKSSSPVSEIRMPDFEVLNAKIASALNRIIHNSHFKRRVSLEEQKTQKEDRLLRGRQIACLIYRVTGAIDSVEKYADLFTIALRNDDIHSIRSGTDFYDFHLMTSWKDCTNEEYESLRNSRPYWNCTMLRFIRRKLDLIITDS